MCMACRTVDVCVEPGVLTGMGGACTHVWVWGQILTLNLSLPNLLDEEGKNAV